MRPETLLHAFELLHALNTLRLRIGVDETAESGAELLPAWSVGHTTKTRAVPVDLAGFGVESCTVAGTFFTFSVGVGC